MVRGTTKVVIAGGGVAALEAALALRALAGDRVSVELLAPEPHFWYRPLAVAEPFGLGEAKRFELGELAARAGATFSLGALASVDAARRLAHTSTGDALDYDALLIACGAFPKAAIPGALTFRGPADTEAVRDLLAELEAGEVQSLAFAVPGGAVWSLPIYELALMTAAWVESAGLAGVEIALVTPEEAPLKLFGPAATSALRKLLEERGVTVHALSYPVEVRAGELLVVPEGTIAADRVLALPRLEGWRIDGIPQTIDGFIPTDLHGRVEDIADVYAAGDATSFPIKQGGIAAQQAGAAAETIAAEAGADLRPRPFRPVLRGLLLTGGEPRFLKRDLVGGSNEPGNVTAEPLWWPPAKIVGRYLAPFLAELAGQDVPGSPPAGAGMVSVEVDLTAHEIDRLVAPRLAGMDDGPSVADVMATDPLAVAPEDTLGEIAERMRERDVGSALVVDFGRLIGIVTSRDLLRAFAGRAHPSEARAREWMTAEPIVVTIDTPLETAAFLLTRHHIHHLPVVDGERAVGMVGLREVARAPQRREGIGLGF